MTPYIGRAGNGGLVVTVPDGDGTVTLSAPAKPPADLLPLLAAGDFRAVLEAVFAGQELPAVWTAGSSWAGHAIPQMGQVYDLLTSAWGLKPARRR